MMTSRVFVWHLCRRRQKVTSGFDHDLAVPLIKDWKIADFLDFFKFSTFFRAHRAAFLRFSRCLPYFAAGILFDGSGRTRKAKCSVALRENPYFWVVGAVWHIGPYSQVQGPYSRLQSGASPGSSVGNINDWILFLWSIADNFCLCFVSGLLPHTQSKTPQNTVFLPKIPPFDP